MIIAKFMVLAVIMSQFFTTAFAVTLSGGLRVGSDNMASSHGFGLNLRLVPKLSLAYGYGVSSIDGVQETELEHNWTGTVSGHTAYDVKNARIKRNSHHLQLRWHPMAGSFFFAGGMISSKMTGEFRGEKSDPSIALEQKFAASSEMLSYSIGNIWDGGVVFVGFEWIGFTRRIKYNNEIVETKETSDDEELNNMSNSFEKVMKMYGGAGGVSYLIFYLGVNI